MSRIARGAVALASSSLLLAGLGCTKTAIPDAPTPMKTIVAIAIRAPASRSVGDASLSGPDACTSATRLSTLLGDLERTLSRTQADLQAAISFSQRADEASRAAGAISVVEVEVYELVVARRLDKARRLLFAATGRFQHAFESLASSDSMPATADYTSTFEALAQGDALFKRARRNFHQSGCQS